jgi:hypothetical protein
MEEEGEMTIDEARQSLWERIYLQPWFSVLYSKDGKIILGVKRKLDKALARISLNQKETWQGHPIEIKVVGQIRMLGSDE